MKTGTKIAIGVGILGAAVGGIAIAARKPSVPPGPVPTSSVPAGLPGAADFNLPEGWTRVGWYSYTGKSKAKMWIRVDKGPADDGTVIDDVPWRWTVFTDQPGAAGNVPIATGTESFADLSVLWNLTPVPGSVSEEYDETRFAAKVADLGAEQIDTMYSGAA